MAQLLTPEVVAEQLAVDVPTLYKWRATGKGPVALKVGKYLRWRQEDVDAYVEALLPHSNVTRFPTQRSA